MKSEINEIVKRYFNKDDIESINIINDKVIITIKLKSGETEIIKNNQAKLKTEIEKINNISKATIILTKEKNKNISDNAKLFEKLKIKNVKKIIAVASGKGGVGKSTTATNIAISLSKLGLKTALFDADIYGPSIPKLLNYENIQISSPDGKMINPIIAHNLQTISIGNMVPKDTPIIWRGIKAAKTIEQLLSNTLWDEVDIMVIDMPPGTGDTQITIAQKLKLDGAIIVSTPQDIALIDAIRGVNMFEKVSTPILGLVENMSYYICENCGSKAEIFGHGGAKETAKSKNVDFLGEIPLHIEIRENSDKGNPISIAKPNSSHSKAYLNIAKEIKKKLYL
jgi:ATP-binding protein involved in chromosome partitioning